LLPLHAAAGPKLREGRRGAGFLWRGGAGEPILAGEKTKNSRALARALCSRQNWGDRAGPSKIPRPAVAGTVGQA